ncbi:efflux RND transporter permease subunit [candidate division KSB1 bacterium]
MEYKNSGVKNSLLNNLIRFGLENRLIVIVLFMLLFFWGIYVMPFDINSDIFPRNPVPVDAIPDIGENQQIVFTEWMGRSPQDVEDQVTYPLTVSLLGVPGVKTIRSFSYFGFSSIYVIFKEDIDFYWSRSRILEKLSTSKKDLPEGVEPSLGPDATALGQIFWYTLEGRDFSLHELRTIQDYYVKYQLASVEGVSEVASVGGYVKEYQIDIDPDAMRAFNITLGEVVNAVRKSNIDVGAKTIEVNRVEYIVRSLGFLKNLEDVENIVIKEHDNTPVFLKNFARVSFGPASRRGALDKEGAQVVGGVVVVRHGENPLAVINGVKKKIEQISSGLPSKELADGTISKVKIVPFYDRTKLINETLGTLKDAITSEILITIIVVIILLINLRSSILVSGLLPLAVLMSFIAMKIGKIDSNIMSLSGIAIAIGTIVDMGIIMSENIVRHFDNAGPDEKKFDIIYSAATEVGGAVITAISTTVVAFLPVFVMTGPEGKLFKPLAFTKTFALIASVLTALFLLPTFAYFFFGNKKNPVKVKWLKLANLLIVFAGITAFIFITWWVGIIILFFGVYRFVQSLLTDNVQNKVRKSINYAAAFFVVIFLTNHWMPLGVGKSLFVNLIFVILLIGLVLGFFKLFLKYYENLLRYFLKHKIIFYSLPAAILIFGLVIWKGFDWTFTPVEKVLRTVGFSEKTIC